MHSEIIDDSKTNHGRITNPNWLSLIVLFILWVGLIHSVAVGISFGIKEILGTALLIFTSGMAYFKFQIAIKLILGILVLGFFNLVSYFAVSIDFYFSFNDALLRFDILLIFLVIVHFILNKDELTPFLKKWFNWNPSESEIQLNKRKQIDTFKKRFSDFPMSDLEDKINDTKIVPEAKIAAQELHDSLSEIKT